jgi:hypothetical protein
VERKCVAGRIITQQVRAACGYIGGIYETENIKFLNGFFAGWWIGLGVPKIEHSGLQKFDH